MDAPQHSNKNVPILLKVLSLVILSFMVLIPLIETTVRPFIGIGIPGAAGWVQHLTLWIGLLGAVVATLNRDHLSVSVTQLIKSAKSKSVIESIINVGGIVILILLTRAAVELVYFQYDSPEKLGGWFPVWLAQAALPIAFSSIALIMSWKLFLTMKIVNTQLGWLIPIVVMISIFLWFDFTPGILILLLLLGLMGMPIYLILAGITLVLFNLEQIPFAALPNETYQMVTQPVLPSIPLFALAGSVLAAGGAPRRLMRFVKAWMAWLPGGVAISSVLACAFFTAITGASGVTILALGGILMPILMSANYKEKFSTGLLTASGSVGLLFPPSLPVILYGVYGHVAIDQLFLGALIPGIFLVSMLILFSLLRGGHTRATRDPFNRQEAIKATSGTAGDLILPVIVLAGFFGGILTIVETAALTAFWAIILETLIYREINLLKRMPGIMTEAAGLIGALLIVLGLAFGMVSYLNDAQIPLKAADWVITVISSKLLFLLILNAMLLVVGALMDIFSAIVIVVPLLVPVGLAFGVDPVHLGVIFLANLELGYLTPPIGMNLFLSSLRFKKPLLKIWKTVIPFLIIFILWVLLITYVPWLSVGIRK